LTVGSRPNLPPPAGGAELEEIPSIRVDELVVFQFEPDEVGKTPLAPLASGTPDSSSMNCTPNPVSTWVASPGGTSRWTTPSRSATRPDTGLRKRRRILSPTFAAVAEAT